MNREPIRVFSAPHDEQSGGLRLLFQQIQEPDLSERVAEVLSDAKEGKLCLDGLMLAWRGDLLVGTAFYSVADDGPAYIWPAAVKQEEDYSEVADTLLREICSELDVKGIWLGQALVDESQAEERASLDRCGIRHVTDLVFLARSTDDELPGASNDSFQSLVFTEGDEERFSKLLERTYVGTEDCPELNGVRSGVEALASHRSAGNFNAALWKRYRLGENDVGILLMADHPDHEAREVVYMGIVPEARGQGLGREMMRDGLNAAKKDFVETVFLAVDVRNSYATAVYEQLGFQQTARRSVHLRIAREHTSTG